MKCFVRHLDGLRQHTFQRVPVPTYVGIGPKYDTRDFAGPFLRKPTDRTPIYRNSQMASTQGMTEITTTLESPTWPNKGIVIL